MGLRFRRSINLGGGFRLNFSKSGVGISAGTRGMRIGIGPSGLRSSVGIPGTGIYYEKRMKVGSSSPTKGAAKKGLPRREPPPGRLENEGKGERRIKLGFFKSLSTPPAEKAIIEGLNLLLEDDREGAKQAMREALRQDGSMADAAFVVALLSDDGEERLKCIELALANLGEFGKFFQRYNVTVEGTLNVTDEMSIRISNDLLGLTLLAAEIYQDAGKISEAISLLEKSDFMNDRLVQLSLGELYYENGEYEKCINILQTIENIDEAGTVALLYTALSFRGLKLYTAAVESLRKALRRTKDRSEEILLTCRFELAETLQAMGEERKAKIEYEKVAAADPEFRNALQRAKRI